MISFLLDQLPEPEREPVRARLAADPEYFDAMQELEYDLCDSYVRGTLDAAPAAALTELERISPYWRQRMELARRLNASRSGAVRPKSVQWLWPVAAAAMLALAVVAGYQYRKPALVPSAPVAVTTVTLVAGTLRSATSAQQIQVPAGTTELVRMNLEADGLNADSSVRATLRTEAGEVRLLLHAVPVVQANRLQLTVPASLLPPGNYLLEVQRGADPPYEYRFTVTPGR